MSWPHIDVLLKLLQHHLHLGSEWASSGLCFVGGPDPNSAPAGRSIRARHWDQSPTSVPAFMACSHGPPGSRHSDSKGQWCVRLPPEPHLALVEDGFPLLRRQAVGRILTDGPSTSLHHKLHLVQIVLQDPLLLLASEAGLANLPDAVRCAGASATAFHPAPGA